MHQILGGVPDQVADGVFGVDAQQVLQNAEERNRLWCVGDLAQDGVEDVQVQVEIDAAGRVDEMCVRFVAFSLALEDVQLLEHLGGNARAASVVSRSRRSERLETFVVVKRLASER